MDVQPAEPSEKRLNPVHYRC